MRSKILILAADSVVLVVAGIVSVGAQQKGDEASAPNILVIMGDNIGYWNLGTYNQR